MYTERPEMLNKFNLLVKNNKELTNESKKILNNKSKLKKSVNDSKLLYGKEKPVENIVNNVLNN